MGIIFKNEAVSNEEVTGEVDQKWKIRTDCLKVQEITTLANWPPLFGKTNLTEIPPRFALMKHSVSSL